MGHHQSLKEANAQLDSLLSHSGGVQDSLKSQAFTLKVPMCVCVYGGTLNPGEVGGATFHSHVRYVGVCVCVYGELCTLMGWVPFTFKGRCVCMYVHVH